jgi:hypothetical protein
MPEVFNYSPVSKFKVYASCTVSCVIQLVIIVRNKVAKKCIQITLKPPFNTPVEESIEEATERIYLEMLSAPYLDNATLILFGYAKEKVL